MENITRHIDIETMRRAWVRARKTAAFAFIASIVAYMWLNMKQYEHFDEAFQVLKDADIWWQAFQLAVGTSIVSGTGYGVSKAKAGVDYNVKQYAKAINDQG